MKKEKKKKTKKFYTRLTIFSIWTILLCVLCWAAMFYVNSFFGDTKTVSKNTNDDNIADFEVDNTPKKDEITILFAGVDEDKTRTDTMIFAKYDTVNNKLYMMSIPRDTYTNHRHATYRLNTIYGYGGQTRTDELIEEIERILDTKIDYHVIIDISMIYTIVEKIGTLEITLDKDVSVHYMEESKPRFELKGGVKYNLKAKEVEDLSRNRYYPAGDIERGRVQRQVIVALIKNLTMSKNIWKIPSIMKIAIEKTDTNITFREAMKYVSELNEIDMQNIVSDNMPLLNMDYKLNGQSTVLINENKAREIVANWKYVAPVTQVTSTNDK